MYPKGIRSVFAELMAKEGIFALYKGVTPVMLRAFPANAVSRDTTYYQMKRVNRITTIIKIIRKNMYAFSPISYAVL